MADASLFPTSSPKRRVRVLLPLPVGDGYDYTVPAGMRLVPGAFVRVPLGPRQVAGVVWALDPAGEVADDKLKPITAQYDTPPLAEATRRFVDWVAGYTLSPRGTVLRLVMRAGQQLTPPKARLAYRLPDPVPPGLRMTEARARVIEILRRQGGGPLVAADLAKDADVTPGVLKGLAAAEGLIPEEVARDAPFGRPDPHLPGRALSEHQAAAAESLSAAVHAGGYRAFLLDGVTGSGKTEVYLEAAAAALKKDPDAQICILLPEIGLTLPFLERIHRRFGTAPAHWHSDLSQGTRRRVWRGVADGSAKVVVGARSALFLPFRRLALIVVDEEHEPAYKQHDGVLYQARDMAVARAAQDGFPVLLVSATPSLETLANVEEGRYDRVALAVRYGPARLPETAIVDMRADPPERGQWLSPIAIDAVTTCLAAGEQVLLYLNRRGYAPVTLCRTCGERMTAPGSDTWLVEHRYSGRLVCHHTGYSIPKPDHCPHCGAPDSLTPCGPGVERIAEEAAARWPDARLAILSSDTMTAPGAMRQTLERMTAGEIDILVATQAAAKGHNFPGLTLVVAVDADLGLAGGDLRAAERTYQTLAQVSGRAGRAERPGRVLLQSYQPESPVICALAAGDREGFTEAELEGRAQLGFPPFGRLAAVILSGDNEARLTRFAHDLALAVPHAEGVEIWGPAPAPLYRLKGIYRQRFLVKTGRRVSIQAVLKSWLGPIKLPSGIRRTVDIDPYSFT
ncbi:primosomal protein N' [Parvularcula bermudensis HTCC2503]|uniref:Replication restart protein PriA n=1 Tax=Parvularcula bermudensis (strain ATCC BAA-594 / HTCC2503 / KCTC 12087) TaxID=314260 RepID=E0TE30_PARBH|nr:primosomal protein N' [Parvularcula bermudensis]ADM08851.1 primosomal protein N' [Parvularcula bermudensis HTCC2503]